MILDDLVVTLDKIGSREADGEDPEHTYVRTYFSTGGATRRLSYARRILSGAFARVYDDEQLIMSYEREWPVSRDHLPDLMRKPDDERGF